MRILPILMLFACSTLAAAAPPAEIAELKRYFDEVRTLEGRFIQETLGPEGELMDRSEGRLAIKRPDRFRFVYETPFAQQIVADGEHLWVYDQELAQVTVRPQGDTLGVGAGALLSGDYQGLQRSFHVEPAEADGWLALRPRSGDWDFQEVRLRLEQGVPREVLIDDGLGQITRFLLEDLQTNVPLPDRRFRFQPPEDVDVVAPAGMPAPGADG